MDLKWLLTKYRTAGVVVILALILAVVAWHDPKAGEAIATGIMGLGVAICGKSISEHWSQSRKPEKVEMALASTKLPEIGEPKL